MRSVRAFAEHGYKIESAVIGARRTRDEAEASVHEASLGVRRWGEDAKHKCTSFQRASRVWKYLVTTDEELPQMLGPAAGDQRGSAETVFALQEKWSRRSFIIRRVNEIDGFLAKGRHDHIQGKALEQIVAWTHEAGQYVREWCQAVQEWQRSKGEPDWREKKVALLVSDIQKYLEASRRELADLSERSPCLVGAAATVMQETLVELARFAGLPDAALSVGSGPSPPLFERPEGGGLNSRVAARLLYLPELLLDDDGLPTAECLPQVDTLLETAAREGRTVPQALEGWMRRRDFRFTDQLLSALDNDEWETWDKRHQDQLEQEQKQLERRISSLDARVQSGACDGVLDYAQRANLQQQLVDLQQPSDGSHVLPIRNFAVPDAVCKQVDWKLQDAHDAQVHEQDLYWKEHHDRLVGHLGEEERAGIEAKLDRALKGKELRIVHELLAELHDARRRGVAPSFQTPSDVLVPLRQFVQRHGDLLDAVKAHSLQQTHGLAQPAGSGTDACLIMSDTERAAAQRVWEAWGDLQRKPLKEHDPRTRRYLAPILEMLGLTLESRQPFEWRGTGRDWGCLKVEASDGGTSVVPQLGSLAHGQYDVLCVWNELSPDALIACANQARLLRPTLVLFFGRLTLPQRMNLAAELKRPRQQHTPTLAPTLLLIDQVLLWFMTTVTGVRWPQFLRVALPFSSVNPFQPGSAGRVPKEMFFGRSPMITSLLDFEGTGSCLVYGGRQLGKSALLRRVEETFHHPEDHRFAVYRDIKNLGDVLANLPAEQIWSILRDELNRGFFAKPITALSPELVGTHIEQRLNELPGARLLILLDEADNFLAQDAHQNFRHVTELKNLMERTKRRVKFVFAGLHNVERFHRIPNHPFVHLGTPLEVGPLEPLAAMQLVQSPLETVGYHFDDELLVLKILSYTNFHPGLIQLFCRRLLEELHCETASGEPPFLIRDATVRRVYAKLETRREIRTRFDSTLGLDLRYRAIVWSIVDDQYEQCGQRISVYPPRDLLERLQLWWPQAFSEMPLDRFRGLLDELCGLGILLAVEGGYRLRSPNLIHLLGDPEEIRNNLFEFDDKPAPRERDFNRHRMLLRDDRRSPLTYLQSTQLVRPQYGVGLVFGSLALGFGQLRQAIEQLPLIGVDPKGRVVCESVTEELASRWDEFLREKNESDPSWDRMVLLARVEEELGSLENLIRASLEFCRKREKTKDRWLRVLLVLGPAATRQWFGSSEVVRTELESLVGAAVRLSRWDVEDVMLHLQALPGDRHCMPAVGEVTMSSTGGWPILLDELFKRLGKEEDVRPLALELAEELQQSNSLTTRFRDALGLEGVPESPRVLQVLRTLGADDFDAECLSMLVDEAGEGMPPTPRLLDLLRYLQVVEVVQGGFRVNRQVAQVLAVP